MPDDADGDGVSTVVGPTGPPLPSSGLVGDGCCPRTNRSREANMLLSSFVMVVSSSPSEPPMPPLVDGRDVVLLAGLVVVWGPGGDRPAPR